MLEHPTLRLGPWSTGPVPERTIHDAATEARLGVARLTPGQRSWWLWRSSDVIRVFETEDEALLLTAERFAGWKPTWQVRDSDDHQVGTVRGRTARDGLGQRLAVRVEAGAVRRWRGVSGEVLAEAKDAEAGMLLSFTSPASPFLRMMLLVDVLGLWPSE